jgi:two-component system NarL family sensor kinase
VRLLPTLSDPALAPAGWVTVVSAGDRVPAASAPLGMRRLLAQLLLAGVVAAALVSVAGSVVIRDIAESQSVHDVAQLTDVLAQSVVQPALTDSIQKNALAGASSAALDALDQLVRESVLSDSLVRVKLWSADGTVVYSDEPRLVGRHFGLDEEAEASFSGPQTIAEVSDLSRPENVLERGQGKLLEGYRPLWTPTGREYLLETYYRYDLVSARSSQLRRAFVGITLSSVVILLVLLLPIMATLLNRARRSQAEREVVLRRSLDASVDERQRIAAALHDGVVQELAAAAFAVAAASESAASRGDQQGAEELGEVATTVRSGVGGLRALLVDIYPPSLKSAGLTAALHDAAAAVAGRSVRVRLDIDEQTASGLDFEQQQAIFRIAQECLRNTVKHARADEVVISLSGRPPGFELTILDDGQGFDPSRLDDLDQAPHLGIALMSDVAAAIGAELAVSSGLGRGTRWRLVATAE